MATLRQIQANRHNARRSTGPRTLEGKAIAARNATTLGLFTRELLLVDEDPAELDALREETYQQLRPAGAVQRGCVERYIAATWRLQRIIGAEVKILARWRTAGWPDPADVVANPDALAELEKLQKHISSLERAMDRALNMLMKLQKRRRDLQRGAGAQNREIEPNFTGPDAESEPCIVLDKPPVDHFEPLSIAIPPNEANFTAQDAPTAGALTAQLIRPQQLGVQKREFEPNPRGTSLAPPSVPRSGS